MKKLLISMIIATTIFIVFGSITNAKAADYQYIIRSDAIYYESSDSFGSGGNAKVNEENPYTKNPCYAAINGYSYLDKYGQIIEAKYIENEIDIQIPEAPEEAKCLLVHFKTKDTQNGWIGSLDYKKVNLETATPEVIVKNIESSVAESKYENTTLIVDYSGSMSDKQKQVLSCLSNIDLSNVKIIVFASINKIVNQDQLFSKDFSVGNNTNMLSAINVALSSGTDQLIIISDLQTNYYAELLESQNLKKITIYAPDNSDMDNEILEMLSSKWKNISISRVKID